MELQDYVRALRKRWPLFIGSILLGLLLAAGGSALAPRTYAAEAEMFVAPQTGTESAELVQGSSYVLTRVKSYARIITSDLVLRPTIEALDLPTTVPELSEQVTASVAPDTVVLTVRAQSDSPDGAASLANTVSETFMEIAPQLEQQGERGVSLVKVTLINAATPPLTPVSPQLKLNLALGLLLGFAVGIAAAVAAQALDRRIHDEEDVRLLTNAPVMGHVPLDPNVRREPLIGLAANPARAESLLQVRTNLQFLDLPGRERSYVVTSSTPGEGKSVTALNLALAMSESGGRVCFVEADLRKPSAARYLGVEAPAVGLSHVLIGAVEWTEIIHAHTPHLDILLAGAVPPNPADLITGPAMRDLLATLEQTYDVVIIDSPPLLPVTDAAVLARRCSGAILVVELGKKSVGRAELAKSLEILDTVRARLLGIVLNKVREVPGGVRGYGSGYGNYDQEGSDQGRRNRRRRQRPSWLRIRSRSGPPEPLEDVPPDSRRARTQS